MIKRTTIGAIVVPWDFSDYSKSALAQAIKLAGDEAPIRVLHIATPLSGPDNGALYEYAEKQKRIELAKRFDEQLLVCRQASNITFHIEFGRIGPEVARFAERHQADLIVLSSCKRHWISKFWFGGLTKSMVRLARRPVLVLQGTRNSDWLPVPGRLCNLNAC